MRIDLNADLAEERGDDAAIFPHLSSANVCCGRHAGGPDAMREAVRTARAHGVVIGAHIGYDDRENFGRADVDMDEGALYLLVAEQLRELERIAGSEGATVRYVKPHGALYHRIGRDPAQATAVTRAVRDVLGAVDVLVPDTDTIKQACRDRDLPFAHEFFADRAYLPDGRLAPRTVEGAVLHDPKAIAQRAMEWLETSHVRGVDGSSVRVDAQSICLHGDTPAAVESARAIHESLAAAGCSIVSWMD